MKSSLTTARFEWVFDAPVEVTNLWSTVIADSSLSWQPDPLCGQSGTGSFENQSLPIGISVFRTINKCLQRAPVGNIAHAEISLTFDEPTFVVQTMRKGGRLLLQHVVDTELKFSRGLDLFKYGNAIKIVPYLEGSKDIEIYTLSIGRTVLDALLGEGAVNQLLGALGLDSEVRGVVRHMPACVSAPLNKCLNPKLQGSSYILYAQAKSLEYLAVLASYLGCDARPAIKNVSRVVALRDDLLKVEGKLPCLSFYADKYNCSVRTLNEEFKREYGSTIYSYLIDYRLTEALQVINESKIALKQLSAKLGYSHVNNFSAAFKKKYGYSPTTPRKKKLHRQQVRC